jgi:hypothetical protein
MPVVNTSFSISKQTVMNDLKKNIRQIEGQHKRSRNMAVRGSLLIVPSKEQERTLFFPVPGYEYAPVEERYGIRKQRFLYLF